MLASALLPVAASWEQRESLLELHPNSTLRYVSSDMERRALCVPPLWTEVTNSGFKYKPHVKYTKEYNFGSVSEFCY